MSSASWLVVDQGSAHMVLQDSTPASESLCPQTGCHCQRLVSQDNLLEGAKIAGQGTLGTIYELLALNGDPHAALGHLLGCSLAAPTIDNAFALS